MKILVSVIVFNRLHTLTNWFRAWQIANKMLANVAVIQSLGGMDPRGVAALATANGAYHHKRQNLGMDIGALQEVIRLRTQDPSHVPAQLFRDWDMLYWTTDDALPMRPDFLQAFIRRFNDPRVGLVSNYLLPDWTYNKVPEHARTVSFAISKEVADKLKFPPVLYNKQQCWDFEWGQYNMHKQVQNMGYLSVPVDQVAWPYGNKPWYMCNDYVWDCGEINTGITWDWRRQQDHTQRFEQQFVLYPARGPQG